MVVTANTTKYTIENDLTKKEKKNKKQTNKHTDKWMYLSKTDPCLGLLCLVLQLL